VNNIDKTDAGKTIYWHRELPPLDAGLMGEHTIEATSGRVPGTLSHRDDLWHRCYRELMANTEARLAQEIARFGGDCADVHHESIDTRHDDAAGEVCTCPSRALVRLRARNTPDDPRPLPADEEPARELRPHAVARLEVAPRAGHDLSVGWMIRGLDADDP
jgi:hypothetical protein